MSSSDTVTDRLHAKLAAYGKKEFFSTGPQHQYYVGFCDALEWVLNSVLDDAPGDSDASDPVDAVVGEARTALTSEELPDGAEIEQVSVTVTVETTGGETAEWSRTMSEDPGVEAGGDAGEQYD